MSETVFSYPIQAWYLNSAAGIDCNTSAWCQLMCLHWPLVTSVHVTRHWPYGVVHSLSSHNFTFAKHYPTIQSLCLNPCSVHVHILGIRNNFAPLRKHLWPLLTPLHVWFTWLCVRAILSGLLAPDRFWWIIASGGREDFFSHNIGSIIESQPGQANWWRQENW